MTTSNRNETIALNNAADKRWLERRLRRSVWCLKNDKRPLFRWARFSAARRSITTPCGKYALVWQTRLDPQAPEGPGNQQTTQGAIVLVELDQAA